MKKARREIVDRLNLARAAYVRPRDPVMTPRAAKDIVGIEAELVAYDAYQQEVLDDKRRQRSD